MRRSRLVATKLKCGALSRTRLGATKLKCGAGRWAPRQAGNVLTLGGLVSGKELRVAAIVSEDAGGTDPDEVDERRAGESSDEAAASAPKVQSAGGQAARQRRRSLTGMVALK